MPEPMPNPTSPAGELEFLSDVLAFYVSLVSWTRNERSAEPGLGGQLLYAGQLDHEIHPLVVAANIAGAATLAASADLAAQKQAIRDGIIDFAVTTLDEALRILKNELRKGEAVAVCVSAAPRALEAELHERGVAPDLIAARRGERNPAGFEAPAGRIERLPIAENQAMVSWSAASAAPQWLPRLDALALDCLDADAWIERRWLRLAPRYLGRMVRFLHAMRCDPAAAERFIQRIELADLRFELGVPVEVTVTRKGIPEHRFSPAGPPRRTG